MISAQELRKTTNENHAEEIQRIVNLELMQIEKDARKAAEMGRDNIRYQDFHTINSKDLKNAPDSHRTALEALQNNLKDKGFKVSQGLSFPNIPKREKSSTFLDISW